MMNWEMPQKQSAVGIFLFAAKAFREMIAVLIVMFGSLLRKQNSTAAWLLTIGAAAILVFGRAIFQYLYFKFYVAENQLIIKKGIFSKQTVVIPFERIQTVQLEQSLFHRIIHHYRVSIDTAGSEQTEVSIHALPFNKALNLKQVLTQQVASANQEGKETQQAIRLSASDLMKLAISHNHIETIGLIVVFIFARFNDIKDWFGIDAYDYLESQGKEVAITTQVITMLVFFAIAIAILISVLRILLKFSDLQIILTDTGFNLRHGLLQSKQQFVGSNKIQYLQWKANWVRRKIGLYLLHVKTTGDAELKAKQKIQVPVTRNDILQSLVSYYQRIAPSSVSESTAIQKQYVTRTNLMVGLPVTLVLVVGFYVAIDWWCLLFLLLLPYFHFRNLLYRKNFKFWVNEDALEVSSGVWGRQRIILNWHKLQVVSIQQSIYQRRNHLANLTFRTASGDIALPYITIRQAQFLADYAIMQTETSQKRWM